MLKSYKDLRRWYPAMEPPTGAARAAGRSERTAPPVPVVADDGAPRFPHYIRDTEPEPFDVPFPDQPVGRRSEFVGGWADWVVERDEDDDDRPGADLVPLWRDDEDDQDDEEDTADGDDAAARAEASARADAAAVRRTSNARRRRGARGRREGPGAATAPRTLRDHVRPKRSRRLLTGAVAVVLLGALGGAAVYVVQSGRVLARSSGPAAPAAGSPAGAETAGDCPTEQRPTVMRGTEPGGTDTGPDAIMWFQHSYYVERSAERAWRVVAPGAAVSPAAVIQRGIDSVPAGTGYCVWVVTLDAAKYSVQVTERRPGAAPTTYDKQTVTTTVVDGRTLITGITAG
ncbi:hypothetical protein [Nocardia aurantia]|uniref:DUF8176 domain-containing protein n=1 Tax=Nocardia aurantia TaxID=2585199 RepID=A0A7K0DT99_9NOCA|nr:hypothetical protein [Nocardia aurantia]MQY28995.1 hypothetical protein [Nocardia aurantia]